MIIKKKNQKRGEKNNIQNMEIQQPKVVDEISVASSKNLPPEEPLQEQFPVEKPSEPEIDLFDIEHIDFEQRQERRRGTRRRGYRRIDDRNLVSRAQEEAENIKQSAFEEGYRKGLEQSLQDIKNFQEQLTVFLGAPKNVFEYIAPDILEISVDIAKKIIKKEVETDPQVLINTIVEVLKTVSKNEPKINIRVNSQVAQFVKDSIPDLTYQYGIDAKINIISDPSIEDGGCVFQTNNGIVDASIDTQIEIIKKALIQ